MEPTTIIIIVALIFILLVFLLEGGEAVLFGFGVAAGITTLAYFIGSTSLFSSNPLGDLSSIIIFLTFLIVYVAYVYG